MFTLSLCDRTMRTIAILETYESLIWTERYNKEGEFELVTTDVGSWLNVIKNDFLRSDGYGEPTGRTNSIPYNYWLKKSDTEVVMMIESFKMDSDVEEGNKITIKGRSLESLLDRMVIYDNYIEYANNPYLLIKSIINKYVIAYENPFQWPQTAFIDSPDERLTSTYAYDDLPAIDFELEGLTVLEAVNKICEYAGFGYNILPRETAGYWVDSPYGRYWASQIVYEFRVYLGLDRHKDVIFSPRFDNFANSEFELSTTEIYTGYYVKLPNLKIITNTDPTKTGEKATFSESSIALYCVEATSPASGLQSYGRMGFVDLSDLDLSDCIEWYKSFNKDEEWAKHFYEMYSPKDQQELFQGYNNANIDELYKQGMTICIDPQGWLATYVKEYVWTLIDNNNRVLFGFSGSAEMAASNYVLGMDYSLGDVIMVENEYGIAGMSQIVELVQSFNTQDGYTLLPTFTTFTPVLNIWINRHN